MQGQSEQWRPPIGSSGMFDLIPIIVGDWIPLTKKQKLEKLPRLEWESIKLKLKVADAVKEFFLRKSNKTFFGNFHDGSFTANFGSGTKAAPRKPFRCLNFLDSVNDFPPKRPNTLARETWGQRWVYIVTTWLHSRVSSGHVGTQRVLSRETFKRRRLNLFICWCNFISQSIRVFIITEHTSGEENVGGNSCRRIFGLNASEKKS